GFAFRQWRHAWRKSRRVWRALPVRIQNSDGSTVQESAERDRRRKAALWRRQRQGHLQARPCDAAGTEYPRQRRRYTIYVGLQCLQRQQRRGRYALSDLWPWRVGSERLPAAHI